MKMKRFVCCLAFSFLVANMTPIAFATPSASKTAPEALIEAARPWKAKPHPPGQGEQCMNWTREILVKACGAKFATLQTQTPWDMQFLGADDELGPGFANSLASEEFGEKIDTIENLQTGDLVFLRNTYGDWSEGVLTHVGLYVADGQYIHRMTSNNGYVRLENIPVESFDSGLRLSPDLCE